MAEKRGTRLDNLGDKRHVFTDEDRKKGIENNNKRRQMICSYREMANALNGAKASSKAEETLRKAGYTNDQMNNQFLFVCSVFNNAVKGNTQAMRLWLQITSQYTDERERLEVEKLKAEIEHLKADSQAGTEIEDLSPLAELLGITKNEENNDDEE